MANMPRFGRVLSALPEVPAGKLVAELAPERLAGHTAAIAGDRVRVFGEEMAHVLEHP